MAIFNFKISVWYIWLSKTRIHLNKLCDMKIIWTKGSLHGTWYDNETRMSDFQRYWTSDLSGTESGLRNIQQKFHSVEFLNQRLKIFKNFVHESSSNQDPEFTSVYPLRKGWIAGMWCVKLVWFVIYFKFTRRKTIKCGRFTMFDNNQGFTTCWTNWWFDLALGYLLMITG